LVKKKLDGKAADAGAVTAMRDLLVHRGPDDCGLFLDGPVGLGHRRLSIIDLGGGHQPMHNADGTTCVVYNGEIYNYPELRTHLTERGRESPYYRKLAPCERGAYHRRVPSTTGPMATDDTANATVVITSTGGALFDVAVSFLDEEWPVYVVDGSDRCYGLPALRHAVENVPARWGVLLDEDAFVLSNERLRGLVAWAGRKGHAAIGVPDGGVFPRRVHNPNALNLFFNVLDLEAIRAVWDPEQCATWMDRGSEMTTPWPPASRLNPLVPYMFDDYEPYYCFYFWLADAGLSTGYLNARMHSDGLSAVVLDHEEEAVVVHSWYAREYDTPGPMRDRILDVIEYARGGEDRAGRWRGLM